MIPATLTAEQTERAERYLETIAGELAAASGRSPHDVAAFTGPELHAAAWALARAMVPRLLLWRSGGPALFVTSRDKTAEPVQPLNWRNTAANVTRLASWCNDRTERERRHAALEFLRRALCRVRANGCGFLLEADVSELRGILRECPGAERFQVLVRHGAGRCVVGLGDLPAWLETARALSETVLPEWYVRDVSLTAEDSERIGGAR
jgi:hypothetical protein